MDGVKLLELVYLIVPKLNVPKHSFSTEKNVSILLLKDVTLYLKWLLKLLISLMLKLMIFLNNSLIYIKVVYKRFMSLMSLLDITKKEILSLLMIELIIEYLMIGQVYQSLFITMLKKLSQLLELGLKPLELKMELN